jgi:hypothetical protein
MTSRSLPEPKYQPGQDLFAKIQGMEQAVTIVSGPVRTGGAARVFTWDYREQPDMAEIARTVTEMSGGRVFMAQADTGTDSYAWVISACELTGDQATAVYAAAAGGT